MTIRVYNTLTKTKEAFEPVTPGKVGIYLCGPTVYDKAHIGHMVGPVIFDAIKRYLVYCGYHVTWVVNITDVDDKLINKANQRGISMAEVARENTEDYLGNLAGLGVDLAVVFLLIIAGQGLGDRSDLSWHVGIKEFSQLGYHLCGPAPFFP